MAAPEGFVYVPEALDEDEERRLLASLDGLDYREVVMHGRPARRTVRHFGLSYDYQRFTVAPTDPLPADLEWLRTRAAHVSGVAEDRLVEVLVTRYPPGAGIGWHRDAPQFGSAVVGISAGAACRMRFQKGRGQDREVAAVDIAPRSAYVISGAARWAWQHTIPATKALRYSVTFRTLRETKTPA
ncbi:MAG TPA: alpha-ketoglutarate-dependent dioxygenase AlkB [Acidimicrobiales bacterium]